MDEVNETTLINISSHILIIEKDSNSILLNTRSKKGQKISVNDVKDNAKINGIN